MKGFWKKIAIEAKKEKRPILTLASMANVTDAAFRKMIAKYGRPDVMWTEFVSCDGVCSRGKKNLMLDLIFDRSEHPIVAQFFGSKPENFYKCAQLAQKLGFDGIDINMGCPDRGVIRQGAGSALIKNPKLAQKIIKETIRGAGKLPVSVKTRIGFNELEYKKWIPYLLKMDIAALTIHGRTKKEMSDVPAHWDVIAEIVKMRDKLKSKTLIIGNGDVSSLADAQEKYEKYGVDGVMVGRAMFGTPWFFSKKKKNITLKFKLKLALEHTKLFEKIFKDKKHFEIMKKHYKAYVSGFDNARKIRMRLMTVKNLDSAKKILKDLIAKM
ncbi:MAG: tRNA dihydrouridine synthase [Minisyncoccota bacterium]